MRRIKRFVPFIVCLLSIALGAWGCSSAPKSNGNNGGGGGTASGSTAPTITTQPANASVTVGATATFSVVATGTAPLSYQWSRGGTAINGATSASYTTAATVITDNGATFTVVVSNAVGSVTSSVATLTVGAATATAPIITTEPANVSVTVGSTATFSVVATGTAPLSYQWSRGGTAISGATAASYTTAPTVITDNGATFTVVVSNSVGSATSAPAAKLTVSAVAVNVTTYHNDAARTGQNLNEITLTPSNVNSTNFGLLRTLSVDGKVDAEPLYLTGLTVGGAKHNVLYVVTENDSVYAFDPDTGTQLWKTSVIGTGEITGDGQGCDQVVPQIGITSTPVIDTTLGPNGAIYVVAMTKNTTSGAYIQRIHALDITTGAELTTLGSPQAITGTYPGTGDGSSGGNVTFAPAAYKERAALLLLNGVIYTTWASHCDAGLYTGWVMAYSESTLAQVSVFNFVPNGSKGASWSAGAGPAADEFGNVYFLAANGTFDTTLDANNFPSMQDYGNAFLKLQLNGSTISVPDYFTMHNTVAESDADEDLGSGGALVLPDMTDANNNTRHLAVGMGKDAIIYVVDRDAMGEFNPTADNVYQEITGQAAADGEYGAPAYYNGLLYYGAVDDMLKVFPITAAKVATTPSSMTTESFTYPGTTPSISANGTTNGIVWTVENTSPAVLHAYPATASGLATELYNSNQAGTRDQFPNNKFITPMIANGKVFVGTSAGVAVFGLL
ncbi:MAG: hypothetical protein WB795_17260 [Candidatus Acidiferrales bacterium]